MNILAILCGSLACFFLGYRFYARLVDRIFRPNSQNIAPSVALRDDVDFVPSRVPVVFSHHFAAIAGAGPIIGPTIALIYGYGPCLLWIILGTILFGAVHDYAALLVSMREKGRSMAEVARVSMGKAAYGLFILFAIFMLLLVTASFLSLTALSLTSEVSPEVLQLPKDQNILHLDPVSGNAMIGGIASTSAIIMTVLAPFLGLLIYRRKMRTSLATLIAIGICALSVYVGILWPVTLKPDHWKIILTVYCVIAAGVPVWLILQPRDFANAFLLFIGIVVLVCAILVGGAQGITVNHVASNVAFGTSKMGLIWPTLFITIACGAISGFHALVAGGTTSKQCSCETYGRRIGYGAMILEGVLAVVVLLAVSSGLDYRTYAAIAFDSAAAKGNPVLAFSLGMGKLVNMSFGLPVYMGTIFGILMVEGFMATTLDAAVRLNRYLFEELWSILFTRVPRIMKTYWFNSLLAAGLMLGLAAKEGWKPIWPVFGTANQLLAALTLTTITIWLVSRGRRIAWVTFLPALFMAATTIFSLFYLLFREKGYLANRQYVLIAVDLILVGLSVGVGVVATRSYISFRSGKKEPVPDERLIPAA